MTLPDLEPRSSTLDALDGAIATLTHARRNVLDEVAYLGREIDRLRAELARMKDERDTAIELMKEVARGAAR